MSLKPSDPGGLFSYGRVVVVGANGAGKTWVAARLGARMGLPVIHNDALALLQGWTYRDRAEVRRLRDAEARKPAWIIEGGPSVLTGEVLARAQVVVWLEMPRGLRMRRVIWRTVRYLGRVRPEHPPGNREWPGLRQGRFIWLAWRREQAMRGAVDASLAGYRGAVVRLRTPAEIRAWLADVAGLRNGTA